MRPRTAIVKAALLAGIAAPAAAFDMTLTLDPESTRVEFTLGATLHEVEGTARLEEGEVRFDPETGEAGGRLVVAAASADTGSAGRDEDMHAKVLESERFPRIVFRPERVEGALTPALARPGGAELSVSGSFEIHGQAHPLTMAVTVRPDGAELAVSATFTVPYVEWGMKDPSKFVLRVAKEVEVRVEARGRLSAPDKAPPE